MQFTQITNTVVMVLPFQFGFNFQTAETNPFQRIVNLSVPQREKRVREEFTRMVSHLEQEGITVLLLPGKKDVGTLDAIFPNNWFSHHQDGKLVLYPLLTTNRQAERQPEELTKLLQSAGIAVSEIIDFTQDEKQGNILEGTGSLVLDRVKKVAFAMESPRTTREEFEKWLARMDYTGVFFHAYDGKDFPIYHTNVVMSIGKEFSVVCLDSIKESKERVMVEQKLQSLDKEIIALTIEQMHAFCGNILQLVSKNTAKIIMSETAFHEFTPRQREKLRKYGDIVTVAIPTIEAVGGGSARCMLAEIFLG